MKPGGDFMRCLSVSVYERGRSFAKRAPAIGRVFPGSAATSLFYTELYGSMPLATELRSLSARVRSSTALC